MSVRSVAPGVARDAFVYAVTSTADGSVWTATAEGLVRARAGREQLFGTEHGLPARIVTALHEDRAGALPGLVRAHPAKLIGFMSVHPRDPHVLDEMDRATGDLGLRGIKLGPNYQNFDPLGDDAARVFARAEELGLPILMHQAIATRNQRD